MITVPVVALLVFFPYELGVPEAMGTSLIYWSTACLAVFWLGTAVLTSTLGVGGNDDEWWVLDSCDDARALLKVHYDDDDGVATAEFDKHAIWPKSKRRREGAYAKALRRWVGRTVQANGVEVRAEAVWPLIRRYERDGLHVVGGGTIPWVSKRMSSRRPTTSNDQ